MEGCICIYFYLWHLRGKIKCEDFLQVCFMFLVGTQKCKWYRCPAKPYVQRNIKHITHTTRNTNDKQSPNTRPHIPYTGFADKHTRATYTHLQTWQTLTWQTNYNLQRMGLSRGIWTFAHFLNRVGEAVKIFKLFKHFYLYIELKCSPPPAVLEEHMSPTPKSLIALQQGQVAGMWDIS